MVRKESGIRICLSKSDSRKSDPNPVAYPELVSGGGSKSRKFKWLVKVGAKGCHRPDKKIMAGGGGSGQPENPLESPLKPNYV